MSTPSRSLTVRKTSPTSPSRKSALVVRASRGEMPNRKPSSLAKCGSALAVAAASLALFTMPANAALDTSTYKAGESAKIESSDLRDQSAKDIVKSLKEEVVPKAEAKLGEAADTNYAKSIVQELETVKGEIDALERQLQEGGGGSKSVIKSTASGIEQQVNALKAMLGFD